MKIFGSNNQKFRGAIVNWKIKTQKLQQAISQNLILNLYKLASMTPEESPNAVFNLFCP
ncbi:MAG: hypothetical protein F6K48_17455 [Okeania sp. SIO3H1]|uniref:hypothetical protein n=1 Tax=Okeania sp. SIO1I7 TaxID=2607772 RepID=UPI0013C98FAA|nr:hypothetical protein [Okeania sp. SIO1I7]NEN90596.1 hypothetical protein [Okeania sp. SIO3H1]NET25717.1 hypothetical protein [Okeania sp. SIO1I7]